MKVIVTRPRLEADAWVKQLRALHFDAVALPLIHISATVGNDEVVKAWENLHQYSAVMFVSSNAVSYFYPLNRPLAGVLIASNAIKNTSDLSNIADKSISNSRSKPRIWATGPGTRQALLTQGEPNQSIDSPATDAAQFDSETLWNIVKNQVKSGDKVLIVRGRSVDSSDFLNNFGSQSMNGRPWLADQLTAVGVQVGVVVSYTRSAPVFDAAELALMAQAAVDKSVWLLSSSEAVANLCTVSDLNWSNARAIATHPRIAQAAKTAGFGVVYESRPMLADVVASIESLL